MVQHWKPRKKCLEKERVWNLRRKSEDEDRKHQQGQEEAIRGSYRNLLMESGPAGWMAD